jgi:hypothetical protein
VTGLLTGAPGADDLADASSPETDPRRLWHLTNGLTPCDCVLTGGHVICGACENGRVWTWWQHRPIPLAQIVAVFEAIQETVSRAMASATDMPPTDDPGPGPCMSCEAYALEVVEPCVWYGRRRPGQSLSPLGVRLAEWGPVVTWCARHRPDESQAVTVRIGEMRS